MHLKKYFLFEKIEKNQFHQEFRHLRKIFETTDLEQNEC